jgi:hypothetical protein
MACSYISSNDNRLYVAPELTYGQVAAVTSGNRIPAVKLTVRQQLERPTRKDKTGTRTYPGTPAGLRKQTTYELTTYMTAWADQTAEPCHGPLVAAAMGGAALMFAGGTAAASANTKLLAFAADHGLAPGQAVTFGGEMRFVSSIVDTKTVELNAPFTVTPSAGSPIGASATYQPATSLGSVSVFDYWDPSTVVQRVLTGTAVDQMKISVNGDYHQFVFSGSAQDTLDSASFTPGEGDLTEFPTEPTVADFDYAIIPGHLGQAWLGTAPDRYYTITSAEITIDNDIQTRASEFGSDSPRCISAGMRTVTADLQLFEYDDDATRGLYQAARQNSPISVMFQLGQQDGQLAAVYMPSVIPEVPEFDDSETRLQWKFSTCRAQGTGDDEIYIAFG